MLTQIVRPLVDLQIRRLASSQTTYTTLIEAIARWLSYLGVRAQVTYLARQSGKITVSLTVGKPDLCNSEDWQQILYNLDRRSIPCVNGYDRLMPAQRRKLQRLFAYLIQIGHLNKNNPDSLPNLLNNLNLDLFMIKGVKSALKVPQSVDRLLKELEPDVIAVALPQAIEIALLNRQLNSETEAAIFTMLEAVKIDDRQKILLAS